MSDKKPTVTKKITIGFVIQTYWDNKCVDQEFVAGEVSYEDANGEPVDGPIENEEYCPFQMRQPEEIDFAEED